MSLAWRGFSSGIIFPRASSLTLPQASLPRSRLGVHQTCLCWDIFSQESNSWRVHCRLGARRTLCLVCRFWPWRCNSVSGMLSRKCLASSDASPTWRRSMSSPA